MTKNKIKRAKKQKNKKIELKVLRYLKQLMFKDYLKRYKMNSKIYKIPNSIT